MTQKEIAKMLNVSVAAVSLALRDSAKIGNELKINIKKLAKLTNYRPNPAAQILLSGKSFNIGVIFPSFCEPFYAQLSEAIQKELKKFGYLGIFLPAETLEEYRESAECLLYRKVDGIISKPVPHEEFTPIKEARVPLIFWGEKFTSSDFVYVDLYKGAEMAVDYLVKLGHEKIGFIGNADNTSDRFNGYWNRLAFHRLPQSENFIVNGLSCYKNGYTGLKKLLSSGKLPTAIITHNDSSAIGAMNAASENGIKIPEELSIIGFDNIEEAQYANPPLTSIDQSIERVAALLIEKLLLKVKNPENGELQKVILEPELIIRKSCGPAETNKVYKKQKSLS